MMGGGGSKTSGEDKIKKDIKDSQEHFKKGAESAKSAAKGVADKIGEKAKDLYSQGKDKMKQEDEWLKDQAKSGMKAMKTEEDHLRDIVKKNGEQLKKAMKSGSEQVKRDLQGEAEYLKQGAQDAMDKVKGKLSEETDKLKNTVNQGKDKAMAFISSVKPSEEDQEILTGCSRDAFFKRSAPLMIGGGAVAYLAQRKKVRMLPIAAVMAIGGAIGQLVLAPDCVRRVAESGSESDFAKRIREQLKEQPKNKSLLPKDKK